MVTENRLELRERKKVERGRSSWGLCLGSLWKGLAGRWMGRNDPLSNIILALLAWICSLFLGLWIIFRERLDVIFGLYFWCCSPDRLLCIDFDHHVWEWMCILHTRVLNFMYWPPTATYHVHALILVYYVLLLELGSSTMTFSRVKTSHMANIVREQSRYQWQTAKESTRMTGKNRDQIR